MEAGWYPDPRGEEQERYYDGRRWTDAVWGAGKPLQRGPTIPVPAKAPELSNNKATAIGCFGLIVIALVVSGIIGLVHLISGDSGTNAPKQPSGDELRYGAFDVCTDFVKQRLKSPGSAKFRNYFEDDGEVNVSSSDGATYTVSSTVDSQNSFGALLRSSFVCQVTHVSGTQWHLVNLSMS